MAVAIRIRSRVFLASLISALIAASCEAQAFVCSGLAIIRVPPYDLGLHDAATPAHQFLAPGFGHHSPIGGYLEAEDLVLVLDVNEKFKPWLVERSRLYDAMNTVDGDKKRGLLRIE